MMTTEDYGIGMTLYHVYNNEILKGKITEIVIDQKGETFVDEHGSVHEEDFGKSVFLYRSDAESELSLRKIERIYPSYKEILRDLNRSVLMTLQIPDDPSTLHTYIPSDILVLLESISRSAEETERRYRDCLQESNEGASDEQVKAQSDALLRTIETLRRENEILREYIDQLIRDSKEIRDTVRVLHKNLPCDQHYKA